MAGTIKVIVAVVSVTVVVTFTGTKGGLAAAKQKRGGNDKYVYRLNISIVPTNDCYNYKYIMIVDIHLDLKKEFIKSSYL